MRRFVVSGAWCVGILTTPLAAQTSLSIYRDGRVVVRQSLPRALERGRNSLTLKLEGLDPGTLFSLDTSVAVLSATARSPSTAEDALARAVGRTLSFVRAKGDTVRATVLSVLPPQYRLPDGRLLLGSPGEPLFPPELVRTGEEALVVLDAANARPRTELGYMAQGASWEAVYQVLLGRDRAWIAGVATVTSQLAFDTAEVQLVAGAIRAARGRAERGMFAMPAPQAAMRAEAEAPQEEAVGETHVYTLTGRVTLEPRVPVATALFPRTGAPYTQEFIARGAFPWQGIYGPAPTRPTTVPVQVWYALKRPPPARSAFGGRPLPAGTVAVYQADSAGRPQLLGEATIDHTPAGADVRLYTGDAFDITTEWLQTAVRIDPLERQPISGSAGPQKITAAYRVTLRNAKAGPVTVNVIERHDGEWKVIESSLPAERLSAAEVRFRVPVPAGGSVQLTYTIEART